VRGNVLVESYDTSTLMLGGHHGLVRANLALGTIKDMTGEQDASGCLRQPFHFPGCLQPCCACCPDHFTVEWCKLLVTDLHSMGQNP
jgi:hypothetical protein